MRTFVYRTCFEPGEKRRVIVVSFPDVPEAITEGRGDPNAMAHACPSENWRARSFQSAASRRMAALLSSPDRAIGSWAHWT